MAPRFELFQEISAGLARDPERFVSSLSGLRRRDQEPYVRGILQAVRSSKKYFFETDNGTEPDELAKIVESFFPEFGAEGEAAKMAGVAAAASLARATFQTVWLEMGEGDGRAGLLYERLSEAGDEWRVSSVAADGLFSIFATRYRASGFGEREGWEAADAAVTAPYRSAWERNYGGGRIKLLKDFIFSKARPDFGGPICRRLRKIALGGRIWRNSSWEENKGSFLDAAMVSCVPAMALLAILNAGPEKVVQGPVRKAAPRAGAPSLETFVSYTTIKIVAPRKETEREHQPTEGHGEDRRRGPVAGHFCYVAKRRGPAARRHCPTNLGAAACMGHRFGPPNAARQEVCSDCNCLRYFRADFVRGSALRGFVEQDRLVQARPGAERLFTHNQRRPA